MPSAENRSLILRLHYYELSAKIFVDCDNANDGSINKIPGLRGFGSEMGMPKSGRGAFCDAKWVERYWEKGSLPGKVDFSTRNCTYIGQIR